MNIEQTIKEIISKQFNVDVNKLNENTNFNKDLSADSLDTVEIVLAIEDKFGIEILDESAESILTIGDVVRYVESVKV